MANTIEGFDFFLSQVKHNLKDATEFAFTHLLQQYQSIMQQADDILLQAARQASSETDKDVLITAMDISQRQLPAMQQRFAEQLINSFQPLAGQRSQAKATLDAIQPVNLISHDDLDDRILIQTLIAHARSHFEKWLDPITAALQAVLPGLGITSINNPFSPNVIGNALFDSVQLAGMGNLANQKIFTAFQQQLFHQLEPFYREILRRLAQAGIHAPPPGSSMAASAQTVLPGAATIPDHRGFKLDTVDDEPHPQHNPYLLVTQPDHSTNEWDAVQLIQDGIIPASLDGSHYIPLQEEARMQAAQTMLPLSRAAIDELLAGMQKGYDPQSDGDIAAFIRQQLALESSPERVQIIKREEENIINLVRLVFNHLASQQNPAIALLLQRLKLPYVRLALTDDLFFHDHLHPARQLLDKLLQLINGSHDDKILYKQIHLAVMKIQLRYNGNKEIFDQLLDTVEGFISEQNQSSNRNRTVLTRALEAEENQRLARQAAGKLVQQHMQVLHRKRLFHQLLEQVWQDVLVTVYQQQGTDSEDWRTALKLLRILLESTGSRDAEVFRQYSRQFSQIARSVSQFLQKHQVDSESKQLLLDQLQELQILFMRGKTPATLDDSELSYTPHLQKQLQSLQQQTGNRSFSSIGHEHLQLANGKSYALNTDMPHPTRDEASRMVDELAIGQWMNYLLDRKATPAQVGFYSKSQQSYVFFDRQHKQLFERSKLDIIEDLHRGFARLQENTQSFDGALAVVNAQIRALQR